MSTPDHKPSSPDATPCKVVVALSGGVDSAVAAALLLEQGYDVTGVFLDTQIATVGEKSHESDVSPAEQARRIGDHLGIPVEIVRAGGDFEREVLRPFAAEYVRARTPNPCVLCNRVFKFRHLLERANDCGAGWIATGHYARVQSRDGMPTLLRGRHVEKDQSYYIHRIGVETLARLMLPLGELDKQRVRTMADARGLPVLDRPESQDVCFANQGSYVAWVARFFPDALKPGDVLDIEGNVIGRHEGLAHYTIGQRKGLGIAMGRPVYVADLDVDANTVTLGPRETLLKRRLSAGDLTWLIKPPGRVFRARAQVRYRHRAADAEVRLIGDDGIEVVFDEPQWAITPGQAVVVYDGDAVLGGGWIDTATE